MHIPDNFLSPPVWATLDAISLPAVGVLARRAQRQLDQSRIPLLGVMGAFVFAAQMINFPVGLGTSGHLVGGALLAITLGPAAASIVLTAILLVQAFVFQDGGVLALGANIFNMALMGVWAGMLPYRALGHGRTRAAGIFLSGFVSLLMSACFALSELLVSGVPMPARIVAVSLGLFVVSAAFEGAITLAVVRAIERLHPEWVQADRAPRRTALAALAIGAVLLAAVGVLFASQHPDGLESFAQQIGIASQAKALLNTPLADYEMAGFASPWLRKAAAGLTGLACIYVVCAVVGRWMAKPRQA